jgi:cobalt-zinc-cadmium efflux system membrane fusion protein
MSTQTIGPRSTRWIPPAIVAVVVIVGVGYFVLRPSTSTTLSKATDQALTVPEGGAGKAGELVITQEAMQLAEIRVEPITAQQVAEELVVSGTVQAGGDDLVKITPRAAGKVIRLLAGAGDQVRAGQTLALLESADLGQAQAAYRQASARASAAAKNLERQRQLARLGQFGKPQIEESRSRAIEAGKDVQSAEKDLTEERTKLAEAQSERRSALSKVTQARAEMEVTKAQMQRAETLLKEELVSRQEVERIRADYQKAAADVEVAESAVAQADARIAGGKERQAASEKELKFAKQRAAIAAQGLQREEKVYTGQYLTNREIVEAESSLRVAQVEMQGAADAVRLLGGQPGGENTVALTSPISGRVQDRSATLGETIDPEHAAFTVVNLNRVWAQLLIAPRDLSLVRVGDMIALTSETAPGRTFRGTIVSIGSLADESTRAVPVRTTLENVGDLLKPGSFVKGSIVTDVRKERVVVPAGALQEHTGKPTIYVAKSDQAGGFEIRHVKLGVHVGDKREISEGLKPDERIAVSGTFFLKSEALKSSLSDGCCAPSGG